MAKTVKEFEIRESTIRGFIKTLKNAKYIDDGVPDHLASRKRLLRSRVGKFSEIDERLFEYYCNMRKTNKAVRRKDLADQAKLLAEQKLIDDFKASSGYITRFLERYSIDFFF